MLDDLDRTSENLRNLLVEALNNRISYKALADWCYDYCDDYWTCLDTPYEKDYENDKGLDVAMEIDTQWELFLRNSYKYEELQRIDLLNIKMPNEWLQNWLDKLN